MPPIASDALVLRTSKLGESSKVVVLLTRERGKLRAVAKGVRGPRSHALAALEPLSEVRVGLHGKQGAELYRLGQCELIRSAFRTGSRGLASALALGYYAELLDAFSPEGEAEDAVYRLATAVLAAAEQGAPVDVLGRYLEAWLLRLHGLYPSLGQCARCARGLPERAPLYYHEPAHGFVCEACGPATGPLLSDEDAGFLERVFREAPGALAASAAAAGGALEGFHRTLVARHLERELHSYRVLREVARELRV